MKRSKQTSGFALRVAVRLGLSLVSWKATLVSRATDRSWEINAESAYVAGANTRGGGNNVGSVDEYRLDLRCVLSRQVGKDVLLRFGVPAQRFGFGVADHAPLPSVLQKVSALIGVDYQLSDHWLLRADLQPGVYSDFQEVSWRDVDAPLQLGAAYLVNADLQWFLGMRIDARSRYPALPAVGVRWRFANEWTLNLLLPNPRLEWALSESFHAYLGAGMELGTFRIGDHFGDDHARHELNHAVLDYFEARVGPGFSWRIRPNTSLEADAGFMISRRFDFAGRDLVFRSDPAPYAQVAFHVRF